MMLVVASSPKVILNNKNHCHSVIAMHLIGPVCHRMRLHGKIVEISRECVVIIQVDL